MDLSQAVSYIGSNKLGIATITLSLLYMFLGLPSQILRIWRTRSVTDISILMFSLLTIQSILWTLYGIQQADWFVTIANAFGSLFGILIVAEYFAFKPKNSRL